ncbi:MAG: efflux RND transporter permease subunit, partial [Betaproteobacteria bacterium]|nr:efflux RND transporter permease subunit [Betaproteobacteria bacterium]
VDGPDPEPAYAFFATRAGGFEPAVTLSLAKRAGSNATELANQVEAKLLTLKGSLIPSDVQSAVTRNYGKTAGDKSNELIEHLLIATLSVIVLIGLAMGWRSAVVVGIAVPVTLSLTLMLTYLFGYTLNRVTLFALIFSIGILVDDAIVVVENIHRHQQLHPGKSLRELIPGAVDEVGGPTILATLTVIAALLPMAFVSGLMGPYMSPIPINASMGMLLSLAVAFVVTPWLARLWMKPTHADAAAADHSGAITRRLAPWFEKIFAPLLDEQRGRRNRMLLGLAVAGLIVLSLVLPATGLVLLKMLPFDNKSEFQVVVDMPAGTPLEQTAAVLHELGASVATDPEVTNYQAYAGTAAPINFNGLVRQYYLRSGGDVGDLQVNLVDKHHRKEQSHAIATRLRSQLQAIGRRFGANVKVIEVPPGPPVLSPIVAEIYGPDAEGRRTVAHAVRAVFEKTPGVVDVDDSSIADAPKKLLRVDRRKAALLGISQQTIATTLQTALSGDAVTWLHDQTKYPASAWVQLPDNLQGDLNALLQLGVKGAQG